ncbi:hypothetical protein D6T65_07435 [Arthrobacter frigidicola]|nr:hypothetical protein D6T65_07435 [Arthrobacter frigidicola]
MPNTLAHALISAPKALAGAGSLGALTVLTGLLLTGAGFSLKRRSLQPTNQPSNEPHTPPHTASEH